MSPFYTGKGDEGSTGLLGEGRVSKADLRMEAVGALDEATAALGLARAAARAEQTRDIIVKTQRDLYGLMAEVAATLDNVERFRVIDSGRVAWLEAQVAELETKVQMPRAFILPGDTPAGAALSVARTITRRAERRLVELHERGDAPNLEMLRYLNRLSSLCFILELFENAQAGQDTTLAKDDPER